MKNLALLIIVCLSNVLPALAMEPEVQVKLFRANQPCRKLYIQAPFEIRQVSKRISSGVFEIEHEAGRFKITPAKSAHAQSIYCNSSKIEILSVGKILRLGPRLDALRAYRGGMMLSADRNDLICENKVKMDDYLVSVLGSETSNEFPIEALKAQSILIQTSMLRYKLGDALNDSTEKQAYLGADYERVILHDALKQTKNQFLAYDSRPIPIYFHSSCGGGTSSSALFTGKVPVVPCDRAVACKYCLDAPFWKITSKHIPAGVFGKKFPHGVPKVISKDSSQRPLLLQYPDGSKQNAYAFWIELGQCLGWDKLPGTRFEIIELQDHSVKLSSNGAGHGVGLCQWGACGLARRGDDYEKILKFYFPGTKLQKR